MTMKEKIIEVLKGNKLTIKEITERINKEHPNITTEARIRSYIERLRREDDAIERCGTDNRYKIWKLKNKIYNENIESFDTQILIKMIRPFVENNIGLDLENDEIERIKTLWEEINTNA